MKRISKGLQRVLAPCGLFVVLLLAGGPATAVTLTIGSAVGQVGNTVSVPVTVSGLVEDVRSFEMVVNWSSTYAQIVAVNTAGTLSAGWTVSHQPGSGTVSIAGASALPLSGNGVLCVLQLTLGPSVGGFGVTFGPVLLNEGSPVPTKVNGTVTSTALPTINISPDTGLLAVGDSLRFTTTGGTPPYTYISSDPAVAAFNVDWLHALAPGFVRATAMEAGAITNMTTGLIEVRPFRLKVGSLTVIAGQMALVPVRLEDPTGFGLLSAEVELTWSAPGAAYAGIETAGTISAAAGWAAQGVSGPGRVSVTMAGITPLASAGVLFYLKLVPANSVYVDVGTQIFNEIYQALPSRGLLTATALPTIGITPGTATLRVGDLVTFNATGTPTPPLVWSTDDSAVATIDAAGQLRARGEGTVRVAVLDALGASAQTGVVSICALGLPALVSSIAANVTVPVSIKVDRALDPLAITSYEIAVSYNPTQVAFVGAVEAGTLTAAWGAPTVVASGGVVRIYHAGATALTNCGQGLLKLEFRGQPGLVGSYTGVALSSALFNEGKPCARVNTGSVCQIVSDVPVAGRWLELWPNQPNPFNPNTVIRYSLERDAEIELAVFSVRGERVRNLVKGWAAAGTPMSTSWDGRDDDGRRLSSGVYYARLTAEGTSLMQKMVMLK